DERPAIDRRAEAMVVLGEHVMAVAELVGPGAQRQRRLLALAHHVPDLGADAPPHLVGIRRELERGDDVQVAANRSGQRRLVDDHATETSPADPRFLQLDDDELRANYPAWRSRVRAALRAAARRTVGPLVFAAFRAAALRSAAVRRVAAPCAWRDRLLRDAASCPSRSS